MTVQLQLEDSGSQVSVDLGEPVEVRLAEIAGTGYLWHVVSDVGADLAVEARTEPAKPPPSADGPSTGGQHGEPAVGGAAERVFTLVAHAPIDTPVVLRRFPPWLGESKADASFEVRITTRTSGGSPA